MATAPYTWLMRTPKLHARAALTAALFSGLCLILANCNSDNPKVAVSGPKVTCDSQQQLCNADAGANSNPGGPYCANLQTDDANCGSCGQPCHAGETCSDGHCKIIACPPDKTLCGASTDAGAGATPYCTNLQTDNAHCGCCGNACSTAQGCKAGHCDDTTSYSFFVFGDMHVGGSSTYDAQDQIAMNQMTHIDPNVMAAFSNGDLVDSPSESIWMDHNNFVSAPGFQPDAPCAANFGTLARYFGSVGDHDWGTSGWYDLWNQSLPAQQGLGHNGQDGIYYSVKFANAIFILLDTEHISTVQNGWLQTTLESAEAQAAQLKFVFFHEPVYSCGSRHGPFKGALPWVDLAEQHNVNVIFGSHTHVYTRTCPKLGGNCTPDDTGIIFVETGAVGGDPRALNETTQTVTGQDAAGNPRSDTYNCTVGQDLRASHGLDNDFCHVQVNGCVATVKCYLVGDGNDTPFDTWTVNGCACASGGSDAGASCNTPSDGGSGN